MRSTTTRSAVFASCFALSRSWSPAPPTFARSAATTIGSSRTRLSLALDYNDPVVGEEFAKVQGMTFEEVEEEMMESGVRVPADMNDMDAKLMLVELRMRMKGGFDDDKSSGAASTEEKIPESFSSKFEEALYTKPSFKELYNVMKDRGDMNSMNVAAEYVNDPAAGRVRYGDSYGSTLDQIDKALSAVKPVTSPKVNFSGFPANMGEAGCRVTLEALGEVVEFECEENEDFPVLEGSVTFDDVESAKAAIQQYNGMDMGMGSKLELTSV